MINKFTIVDGHVHTFMSEDISAKIQSAFNRLYEIQFKNPGTGTINDVKSNMKSIGIDYTVMTNFAPAKIIHENNIWTLQMAAQHKELIPLVSFHPDMDGDMCNMLEAYIEKGAKGIKLHPMAQGFDPNHEFMQALYKFCNEIGFPIIYHCGRVANARLNEFSDVSVIRQVINKYQNIPFVLTHMADGSIEDVLDISGSYGNVYFDTSIVITGYPQIAETNEPSWLDDDMVVDVINSIGADKVIFGSDYPCGSPRHDIHRILGLKMKSEQKRDILGENALKLYKINMHNI